MNTQSVAALGENHRSSCCETGVTGGRLTLLLLAVALPGVHGVAGDSVTGGGVGGVMTGGTLGITTGGVSWE